MVLSLSYQALWVCAGAASGSASEVTPFADPCQTHACPKGKACMKIVGEKLVPFPVATCVKNTSSAEGEPASSLSQLGKQQPRPFTAVSFIYVPTRNTQGRVDSSQWRVTHSTARQKMNGSARQLYSVQCGKKAWSYMKQRCVLV